VSLPSLARRTYRAVLATVTLVSSGCAGKIEAAGQTPPPSDAGADAPGTPSDAPYEGGDDALDSGSPTPTLDAMEAMPSSPGSCPLPQFAPPPGMIAPGTNVTITAPGLPPPPTGIIFYTMDGTLPWRHGTPYTAGTTGVPLVFPHTIIYAMSSTLGTECDDSPVVSATYDFITPDF
jgi:hypothetical protein